MLCSDFDPDRKAVINPEDNFSPLPGFPQMCMGVYSQPIVESLLQRFGGEEILALRFCSGPVPVYRVRALGQEFALFVPHVGGAASGSMMEELAAHGGRCFVFFGSCGVLRGEITDGHLILPTAAVRDEGLSYHYLPPADEVALDPACVAACRQDNALNASLVEAFCQIVALCNALVHVVEVAALVQANCQSHDVTAGHAAVGVIAVAGDLLDLQANAHVHLRGPVFIEVGEVLPE